MARQKTSYPGVFFKEVRRIGGKGTEKSYYIIFKKNGKNIEEHVGYQYRDGMSPSKAAQIRGQRIENKRLSKKEIRLESEWTFSRLWDKYVEHRKQLQNGQGPNHADVSRCSLYIKDTIGNISPANLRTSDLDAIHEKLTGKANGTRYAVLQLINRLSTFGKRKQLCAPISFFIELPKVDIERTESLSNAELQRLLEVLHADGGQVAQAMELAIYTGLRRGEILNLQWTDIFLDQGHLKVKGKSKKTNSIPLNEPARRLLESLRSGHEKVFYELETKSQSWIVNRGNILIAKAGLPDDFRPFHGMRHSFASALASAGVPLFHVSKLLTHKNLQMTTRYSHLSDQSLKDATEKMSVIIGGNGK